jgi:hypothetical protein
MFRSVEVKDIPSAQNLLQIGANVKVSVSKSTEGFLSTHKPGCAEDIDNRTCCAFSSKKVETSLPGYLVKQQN